MEKDAKQKVILELDSILKQDTLSEKEKITLIRQLCNLCIPEILHNDEDNKQIQIFLISKSICNNIGNCSTELQHALLDYLEIVASYGAENYTLGQHNRFFDTMHNVGLPAKIWSLLIEKQKKVGTETCNQPFVGILIHLVRIYLQIMRGQYFAKQKLKICIGIIEENIIELNNVFQKRYGKMKQEIIKQDQIDQDFENILNMSSQTLHCISYINSINLNYITNITKILKQFKQLIHINWTRGKQFSIFNFLPDTPTVVNFRQVLLLTIFYMSSSKHAYIHIFEEDEEKFFVAQYIINTYAQYQSSSKQSNNENVDQLSLLDSFHYNISHALSYFRFLLNHLAIISSKFDHFPDLLKSLSSLALFNVNFNLNQDIQRYLISTGIRLNSIRCLFHLTRVNGDSAVSQLVKDNIFTSTVVRVIGTCGGSHETNNMAILVAFKFLEQFFDYIRFYMRHEGKLFDEMQKITEQFEEEGALEELYSRQYIKKPNYNERTLIFKIKQIRQWVINIFINKTNGYYSVDY